jgi:glycosyltransferase involved in cell wall biosynthesis
VVFVGRLTAIKRPDRLIEALELVLNSRPDAVLAIAGEGELLSSTRRLAEPLGSSIRFLGWQADLNQVYAAADCAVLTSDSEGTPVALIEAAMAGVPSVTTDVGSAREVVLNEVTGLVVAPEPVAIADGLVRLFDDDLRKRLGESAKNRAEREFGMNRLVDDHLNLYGRLVANIPTKNL